jgi:hypothetical protein
MRPRRTEPRAATAAKRKPSSYALINIPVFVFQPRPHNAEPSEIYQCEVCVAAPTAQEPPTEARSDEDFNGQAGIPAEQDVNQEDAGKLKSREKTYSPEVMADPAAKAHAYRGATEFRTDDGEHRLYFDFSAKKKLYGLAVQGSQELPPEKIAEYRRSYHSAKLSDFPEKAFHNGKPISPDKAFDMLCSNLYYDMNRKKMIGLLPYVQTRAGYLKQRSLDMGGKEYVNEDKGLHRIYFQSATAVKNLYGLETNGKAELSAEQQSEAQKNSLTTNSFPICRNPPRFAASLNRLLASRLTALFRRQYRQI